MSGGRAVKISAVHRVKLDKPVVVYDVVNAAPNNNFFVKCDDRQIIAHNCFLDEISFSRNQSIQRQMEKAKEVFDAALERIQSRFTKFGGIFDGLIVMASSKRTDQAFAEVYAKELIGGKNGHKVYVFDKPRWEVLPEGTYSGEKFPVAIGDKLRPSEIIKYEDVETYRAAGYRIIYPPIETYDEFARDMIHALTNIAGESVNAAGTFLAGEYIAACINRNIRNPFSLGTIYCGTKDAEMYQNYFDMSKVSPEDLSKPLYIHLDASLGNDGNTISGGNIAYAQDQLNAATGMVQPELHFKQVFKIKVRAPKGDRTMLRKNEQFIFWLVQQGFKIAVVTSDQYQCLRAGSLILTDAGYRPIETLSEGDSILSYNIETQLFEETTVANVWQSRHEKKFIRVKTSDSAIETTEDHLFLTPTGYKRADQLTKYDVIIGAKPLFSNLEPEQTPVLNIELVETEEEVPFYDIETTSKNHNYLTSVGVVHNSAQFGQDLAAASVPYRYQSIDKVTNGINQQYSVLRNVIYENRISLLDDEDQTNELLHLVRYPDGKVDKPSGGQDDSSQALCGWVYAASLNKENYILTHSVLESTMIGSTAAEQYVVDGGLIPQAEANRDLFLNEFGAYKTETMSGLRPAFDTLLPNKDKQKESKSSNPFNFF